MKANDGRNNALTKTRSLSWLTLRLHAEGFFGIIFCSTRWKKELSEQRSCQCLFVKNNSYANGFPVRSPPRTINWFWNDSPEANTTFRPASKWPLSMIAKRITFIKINIILIIILQPLFLKSSIYHFDIQEQIACFHRPMYNKSHWNNSCQYQNSMKVTFNYSWREEKGFPYFVNFADLKFFSL